PVLEDAMEYRLASPSGNASFALLDDVCTPRIWLEALYVLEPVAREGFRRLRRIDSLCEPSRSPELPLRALTFRSAVLLIAFSLSGGCSFYEPPDAGAPAAQLHITSA